MTVEYFLKKFSNLYPKSIDLSLDRIKILLNKLGNPEKKLPPVIHVAGTNGKGSTVSFLKNIFSHSDLKVQTYTSPHLISFNERIRLADGLIKDDFLIDILKECNFYNKDEKISFFEITTAAAFLAFSKSKGDILILEVGLGGRLDTTNVIEKPLLSTITPISLDHTEFLGETLEEVAYEKAGIIKSHSSVVIGPQSTPVIKVLKEIACQRKNNTYLYSRDWDFKPNHDGSFILNYQGEMILLPKPNLIGPHQISNAAQAAACAILQKEFKINHKNIATGIKEVDWPGRLQKVYLNFPDENINNQRVWVDGAHNPNAALNLSKSIKFIEKDSSNYTVLILGMLKNKDFISYVKHFNKIIDYLICIPVPNCSTSHNPEELKMLGEKYLTIPTETSANFIHALQEVRRKMPIKKTKIIISGSLYLVGEVLRHANYKLK